MDRLSILSWNIRGSNNATARRNLRAMITKHQPTILLLQETKCENLEDNAKDSIWNHRDHSWLFSPARGMSGGILVSWQHSTFSLESSKVEHSWIWVRGKIADVSTHINCINIYSPPDLNQKIQIWNQIGDILINHEEEPVCIMGDFNSILEQKDRANCAYNSRDTTLFKAFVKDFDLWDLPINNYQYTWFGPKGKCSRLDRALVNHAWVQWNTDWWLEGIGRKSSDHVALILKSTTLNWGPRPFKVFNSWLKDINFQSEISSKWKELSVSSVDWHAKIRALRLFIKDWNINTNGNCLEKVSKLEMTLEAVDKGVLPQKDRRHIELMLQTAYKEREEFFKQKSRLKWNAEGDANTRYFHSAVKHRIKKCHINGIMENGTWHTIPSQVKKAFFTHFSKFFNIPLSYDIFELGSLVTSRLSQADSTLLIGPIHLKEIKAAVFSMDSNKSPGPDGFNIAYYKSMWQVMQQDITQMMDSFHSTEFLPPGINSSFIVLIPKTKAPKTVSEFRPISLINSSLKILLKILATRLGRVIGSIVSVTQSAFIKGRNISDSILIASEMVHSIQSGRVNGLILKLDFAKAFDTIRWSFLFHSLDCFGFPAKWIAWLKSIFKTIKLSVLVNGSPTEEFRCNRGLRQGDPMSPLLFNIVVEILHLLLAKAEHVGLIKGIKLGEGPTISHLQFADDTVILLENTSHSCQGIKIILNLFEILSGLKINYNKSLLFTSPKDASKSEQWANLIGCKLGSWPLQYLGAPLGLSIKRKLFWAPLVNKVRSKLAGWKCRTLNKSGRAVLIKSTLNTIPSYWFNLFRAPKNITSQLEQIKRRFFWQEINEKGETQRKLHFISWNKLVLPKELGGIGLADIEKRNLASLTKLRWKFCHNRSSMWRKVLIGKYGAKSIINNINNIHSQRNLSPIMYSIQKAYVDLAPRHTRVSEIRWNMKDGSEVEFWHDWWNERGILAHIFQNLYILAIHKFSTVKEVQSRWPMIRENELSFWTRALSPIERQEVTVLNDIISNVELTEGKDELKWGTHIGPFNTSTFYKQILEDGNDQGPWNLLWKQKIPPKIKWFLWQIAQGCLPTLSLLSKRKIVEDQICKWCNRSQENITHIFWDCTLAKNAWHIFSKWTDIPVKGNAFSFENLFKSCLPKDFGLGGGICVASVLWSIWLARNEVIFRKTRTTFKMLEHSIKSNSMQWGIANDMIFQGQESQWFIIPRTLLKNNIKSKKKATITHWFRHSDLVGFIDGAWKQDDPTLVKSGIGGFLLRNTKNLVFIFSGPTCQSSPYDTELEAFIYLVSQINTSSYKQKLITIFSDSKSLVDNVKAYKIGGDFAYLNDEIKKLVVSINLVHIDRSLNEEADNLAKEGMHRLQIIAGWV